MKTVKKVISLTMAVVIMITTSPILQAADLANLDRAQLDELRAEVLSVVENPENFQTLKTIPSVKTLKKRYDKALEIYEANLQNLSGKTNKQDNAYYESYINELKKKAEQRVYRNENGEFDGFNSRKEKEQAAFYTVLLEEMEKHNLVNDRDFWQVLRDAPGLGIVTLIVSAGGILLIKKGTSALIRRIGWTLVASAAGAAALHLLSSLFTQPSKPYFSLGISANEALLAFLDKPFYHLANFKTSGVDDFGLFYNKSKKCAEVLYDVVDIEYYTAENPSGRNMMDRIYTQTVTWNHLSMESKVEYLHNLAERLREEAQTIEEYHQD